MAPGRVIDKVSNWGNDTADVAAVVRSAMLRNISQHSLKPSLSNIYLFIVVRSSRWTSCLAFSRIKSHTAGKKSASCSAPYWSTPNSVRKGRAWLYRLKCWELGSTNTPSIRSDLRFTPYRRTIAYGDIESESVVVSQRCVNVLVKAGVIETPIKLMDGVPRYSFLMFNIFRSWGRSTGETNSCQPSQIMS